MIRPRASRCWSRMSLTARFSGGSSRIGKGRAYLDLEGSGEFAVVAKKYLQINGRPVLIENVGYRDLLPMLDRLPPAQARALPKPSLNRVLLGREHRPKLEKRPSTVRSEEHTSELQSL